MAPSAQEPNSRASSGPDTMNPDPMIEASGVTVASHRSQRENRVKVRAAATAAATIEAAMVVVI